MLKRLETNRLVLEKLSIKHLSDAYVSWMNDPDVYRFLETEGDYTKEDLMSYLVDVESRSDMLFWAIIRKDNGQHIGNIKIDPVNRRHRIGEYGILIGDRQSWGKGFAKEASEAVIEYCFSKLNLRKINLGVVTENFAAVALYERIGFVKEGHFKKHGFYNGKYCDCYRMAIFNLKSED
ncbi:GNAT family protein [uncultured Roseivirga sp.]|uniref:GNAT family N-acetyltransferase n=1 Tax=uncultured Roseivirga sp. TaxID=543088 RepID=UPI0030D6FE6B|tara:strand:+ start:2966 stop:3502 length:537 start_codon:yes stop_codon:yes gene_type:complete